MKSSRYLTDYRPAETWRQRRAREAAERRESRESLDKRIAEWKARQPTWEPPF